jgi:hypothetical protein
VNLLGDDVDTINRNRETSIDCGKEVGIEVNVEKLSICWCLGNRLRTRIAI